MGLLDFGKAIGSKLGVGIAAKTPGVFGGGMSKLLQQNMGPRMVQQLQDRRNTRQTPPPKIVSR
jgi:hypothetical protein